MKGLKSAAILLSLSQNTISLFLEIDESGAVPLVTEITSRDGTGVKW